MPSAIYRWCSAWVFSKFRARLRDVNGLEHLPQTGGFILAANHVDWLDGFYISSGVAEGLKRPINFITSSSNYWWSGVTIPLPDKPGEAIAPAVEHLKHGGIICNFVEGQRNHTQTLLPGKTGTVRMAIMAGVPVIPLGLDCEPTKSMWYAIQKVLSKDYSVRLKIGAPLMFTKPSGEITNEWLHQETQRLMAAIAPLCGKQIATQ